MREFLYRRAEEVRNLFYRWAELATQHENERLRSELEATRAKLEICELQVTELSAVVARNVSRVRAETAAAAQVIAGAERK